MKKAVGVCWIMFLVLASLPVITKASTTVYTSRPQWEQAVGYFEEEFFTDATLNPGLSVDSDAGYVDVTGQEQCGVGVWWDRVVPSGDSTDGTFQTRSLVSAETGIWPAPDAKERGFSCISTESRSATKSQIV